MTPATPYLDVDAARLEANVARVQEAADARGIAVRPHVKTHKSLEIARLQRDAGARGITVATLGEAEVFVAGGFDDVLIAYPLLLDAPAVERARSLADRARLSIGVDSVEGAHRATPLAGIVSVTVEIDAGHHRTGVSPGSAGEVAAAALERGIEVAGVFSFPGHSYAPGVACDVATDEAVALDAALASLPPGCGRTRSGGSTPSLAATLSGARAPDEVRPGVYVFGDAQQWELGHVRPEQIALTCVARVVSHAGGRVVLDAGSKVLGADRAAFATGFGRLLDRPDARVAMLSEHHAVVEMSGPLPRVGESVRIVPNHVCSAVNLADALWMDGRAVPVDARGRNA